VVTSRALALAPPVRAHRTSVQQPVHLDRLVELLVQLRLQRLLRLLRLDFYRLELR
jgi:hypothetical protein